MDTITIRDLALRCVIGIYPEERSVLQDVIINIRMGCDLVAAGQSDCLEDTVDYKAVKKQIVAMVEDSSFFLLEALAERVSDICLATEGVRDVTVSVDKPGALRFARSVAVEITRPRSPSARPDDAMPQ